MSKVKSRKAKIRVTFNMVFEPNGKCETEVHFEFVEHPEIKVSGDIQKSVSAVISTLAGEIAKCRD